MTRRKTRAASSPDGRLPGRSSDSTGLPVAASKIWMGWKAVLAVMGVEQRQLLAAVDRIGGVVDVEHDALGHALEAVAEQIDHRQPHARQRAP